MNNVFLIDKPESLSSFDIVKEVRRKLKIRKVGHTGTLDPFATGLIVVCTGSFTRLTDYFHRYLKTYKAVFTLGEFRDTDDKTGKTIESFDIGNISVIAVENALKKFVGKIAQLPPMISAKRINGERLYRANRKGKNIKPKECEVFIEDIRLLEVNLPDIEVEITCSTGTYIRSIARDLGIALNCGGYVKELRRTSIGPYSVLSAKSLIDLEPINHLDILPDLDALVLEKNLTQKLLNGNDVFLRDMDFNTDFVRIFTPYFKKLIAICKIKENGLRNMLTPDKVFEREII